MKYLFEMVRIFILFLLSTQFLNSQTQAPEPFVRIMISGDSSVIYVPFNIQWECIDPQSTFPEYQLEYRYKLDVPGDWVGGISYQLNKWTEWTEGHLGNLVYNDFNIEGKYTISVQCRNKNTGRTSRIASRDFQIFWEHPDIQAEAFNIDWNAVNSAKNDKEKFSILAEEYKKAFLMWNQRYEYQHKLTQLTTSPEEIIATVAGTLSEEGIYELAGKQAANLAKKILLPKTIYDIIKQGIITNILISRRKEATKALFMAAISYRAWKDFEKKANELSSDSPLRLAFLIDSSGSMAETDPKEIRKTALNRIIDLLRGHETIILIDFDSRAKWINSDNYTNIDADRLKRAVATIDAQGGTAIGLALDKTREIISSLKPEGVNTGIMLLSDGKSSYNDEEKWFAANNIPVYTISYKDMGDPVLLSRIAAQTRGLYIQANNEEDVIVAFQQFYDMLSGQNKYVSHSGTLAAGHKSTRQFFVDPGAEQMYLSLSWMDQGVDFKVRSPGGKEFSKSLNPSQWQSGSNYEILKLQQPEHGRWTADIENNSSTSGAKASYVLEAGGKSGLHLALDKIADETGIISYQFKETGGVNMGNIQATIKVRSPGGKITDISTEFGNGRITYLPTEGQGTYQFDISLEATDKAGNKIQRVFNTSEFVDKGLMPYVSTITNVLGNTVYTGIGIEKGAYVGMKCYIYKPDADKSTRKAIGYITFVTPKDCIIEISEFFGYETITIKDIVELDAEQWLNNLKY